MSLNLKFLYSQTSAKLVLEGLPDLSLNQSKNNIGIVSTWKLTLIGSSELEGKLIHLKSLMNTVLPYARYCVSNAGKQFGDSNGPVTISPFNQKHKISLTSSQEDIKALEIILDDAELSDLVRCLDSLKTDQRVLIDWELVKDQPLDKREIIRSKPLSTSIGVPLLGLFVALITTYGFWLSAPMSTDDRLPNQSTDLKLKD